MESCQNLAQGLENSAKRFPGKDCIIFDDKVSSYGDINKFVNQAGNAFLRVGIKKGDRVLIDLLNCPEMVIVFYALAKIGAIFVPVNYLLNAGEVKYIVDDAEPSLIITNSAKLAMFGEIKPENIPLMTIEKNGDRPEGVLSFWEEISRMPEGLESCPCERDDLVTILYTSGTTGKPKGVMLTHSSIAFCSSLYTDSKDMIDDYGHVYSQDSIMICALPLYHCYGQNVTMITVIASGGTMLIIDRFSPDKVLDAITKYRATMFAGVPTMYAYLTSSFDPAKHDLSSAFRFCISAGAGLPQEVRRGFKEKTGLDIVEGFGITEASAQALANPQNDLERCKLGSIGYPFQGTEAKVVDDDGREVPPQAIGELVIKGDHVMKGYWKMPEETAKTIIDGWLHTGDLAKMDEDGYFYIVDRKKDLIIVGGENVVPLEIEEVLYRNPKILEAAVVGQVDTVKGEIIKAVVVLKQGMQATPEELITFCSSYLAKFKVPEIVEFRDELPKNATGKILRKMLR